MTDTHTEERRGPAPMATPEGRTATWRKMRSRGDVYRLPDGRWMLTSAEAVQRGYREAETFSSTAMEGVHAELPVRTIPTAIDPPEHRPFRRLLDPMFAPRVVHAVDGELRRQVRELVSTVAGTGRCDVMGDLASLYPTSVFLAMFGFPLADRDELLRLITTMVDQTHRSGDEAKAQSETASWALYHYMERRIDEKRARPADDILSRIVVQDGDDAWPLGDIIGFGINLTAAGLDTVTATIGSMLLYLARDPDLRARVRGDELAANAFIEEILRLEPPAPMFPRLLTRDIEVHDVHIAAGETVMINLATANRDPRVYPDPDTLDLDRADLGHFTFGRGIHRCLGSHLARRELRLVLEEFHRQIPDYALAPGFEPRVEWPSGTVRLRELPLVFAPAG
jgi:cytochrome P450